MRRFVAAMMAWPALAALAHAQVPAHGSKSPGMFIEHAEILLPPADSRIALVAYLAIWNGRPTQANLTSVESDAFGSITLQQTIQSGVLSRVRPVEGVISIPGHAELLMKPEGIYLKLYSPKSDLAPGQELPITAVFADGSRLSTQAAVLRAGALPTDHHHGEADGTGNE